MKNRIGIVGGGQLGRMLAFEAKKLGFIVTVIDPTVQSPAGQVSDHQIVADVKDEKAIRQLASQSDYLTFEIELANSEVLGELAKKGVIVNPSAKTLSIIKDKFKQKQFLKKSGIPVAKFAEVNAAANAIANARKDILTAAEKFGLPLLLKARMDAYDGRGNVLIKKAGDIDPALEKLVGRDLYVEQYVPFIKELAVMVARNTKGAILTYPVVQTIHKNNICHLVLAPAPVDQSIQRKAQNLAKKVMQQLKGAGVFGIEMFLTKDGKVLVNEIAPRVHNSGHYTMEACVTSQFEQHIRAITGLPLGSTTMLTPAAVMINILGERLGQVEVKHLEKTLALANTFVHVYGKKETKPDRKMGHITVIDSSLNRAIRKAKLARKLLTI